MGVFPQLLWNGYGYVQILSNSIGYARRAGGGGMRVSGVSADRMANCAQTWCPSSSPSRGRKSSFLIALIFTTRRRIQESACAIHGPKKTSCSRLRAVGCAQGREGLHPPADTKSADSRTFFFFFNLVTGPRRSLSRKLSDTRVYEPQIRNSKPALRDRSPFWGGP